MIVSVAENAMNKNKCPFDVFIPFLEWMRAVDQDMRVLFRAGFIHSVQSEVVEAHGAGRAAAAASKSSKNMGK